MALLITLDNVYTLYNIDPSMKTEGIVILQQRHDPSQQYSSHHRLFDGILIGFMLEGAMKSQIHFLEYEVNKGDIAILQPQLLIDTKSLSDDAEILTIGLSLDFITEYPMLRELVMNNQIRWQPIIRLKPEDIRLQNELLSLLQNFYHKKASPNKTQMLRHLVMVLINMIVEVYSNLPTQKSMVKNRTHELIDDFYQLLSKHALKERSVVFYAEKLNLTAQYLSTFLKQKTGKGVLQWIDYITILHAKTLLKSTHLSIKEISNELHFEETSIFCRYFKRVVGISPKTYRSK